MLMFDPGVRQACIDLTPTAKSDRCVKKQDLAIFRLKQYNRFLHVCLCPTVVCLLLLLFYLIAEKHTKQHACSKFRTGRGSTCDSIADDRCADTPVKRVYARRRSNKCQSRSGLNCRIVMKCTIQMLLLRAGDVEPNPGPTKGVFSRVGGTRMS